jgi:hypothetical protein
VLVPVLPSAGRPHIGRLAEPRIITATNLAGQRCLLSRCCPGAHLDNADGGDASAYHRSQWGYSQLTVVPCLVNGFTPRVGRRW